MGSYVSTSSNAVDNRLALTDNALGLSNYGGKMAFQAPVFDFSQSISSSGKKSFASGGGVNDVSISILDGGAIDKSFDFAAFSLSEVLSYLIDGAKRQQQAAQYTADTVSKAVETAAKTQAEAEKLTLDWWKTTSGKALIVGAGLGAVWYVWGRK